MRLRRLLVPLASFIALASCSSGSSDVEAAATPMPATTSSSAPVATPDVTPTPNPYADLSSDARNRQLISAARSGNADKIALLLEAGADLETRNSRDRTPLLLAVTEDRVDAARTLIAAGADPDALDDQHDTPWLVTGVTGNVEMARVILKADPDLTIRNRFGGLSHIPASERGHADYVEYVLANTDIAVDHVNDLGWTALLEAVILGKGSDRWQRIVQSLVDAGADTSIADRDGVTALQHARARGFDRIAAILQRS